MRGRQLRRRDSSDDDVDDDSDDSSDSATTVATYASGSTQSALILAFESRATPRMTPFPFPCSVSPFGSSLTSTVR